MTADDYNWVQSIYFVSSGQDFYLPFAHDQFQDKRSCLLIISDQLHYLRSTQQPTAKEGDTVQLAISDYDELGHCLSLPCCRSEQRRSVCSALHPWDDGGWHISRFGCAIVQLVPE